MNEKCQQIAISPELTMCQPTHQGTSLNWVYAYCFVMFVNQSHFVMFTSNKKLILEHFLQRCICIVSCLLAITSNCLFADLVQTFEPLLWREPLPSVVRLSLLLSTSSLLSLSSIIAVVICRQRRQNCEGNIPTLTA